MSATGGVIMGAISLGEGTEKVGIIGIIIAIIAVVLPLAAMIYIGVFIFAALSGIYW